MSLVNHKLKKRLQSLVVDVYEHCLFPAKNSAKLHASKDQAKLGGNTAQQAMLSEAANKRVSDFLIELLPEFGCDDKNGVYAATMVDLFFDYARESAILKEQVLNKADAKTREKLQLLKDILSGISYLMTMHMGNDVLYFKREDQLVVYKVVRAEIFKHLLQPGGVRMAGFARLLIEPLFAYNHFEDDENDDGIEDIDDDSSSYGDEFDESGEALEQKKLVIKGKNGFKIKLKM